jgi:hypothetical protein
MRLSARNIIKGKVVKVTRGATTARQDRRRRRHRHHGLDHHEP